MEKLGSLGTSFKDGEIIIRQGETADNMFVVQEGQVEIIRQENGLEIQLFKCGRGQFVGLSALFDGGVHQANVRSLGNTRLITVHRKNLLSRMHEDPSLAFRIIEVMAFRNHKLADHIMELTLTQEKS